MSELAKEIVEMLKHRGTHIGRPALITLQIGELELESIIAARLAARDEKVRKAINRIGETIDRARVGVHNSREWDDLGPRGDVGLTHTELIDMAINSALALVQSSRKEAP